MQPRALYNRHTHTLSLSLTHTCTYIVHTRTLAAPEPEHWVESGPSEVPQEVILGSA